MKNRCEICRSEDLLSLDEHFKGVDMVACAQCGLAWNRNMADENAQIDFYEHENRAAATVKRRYLVSMLARAATALDFLEEHLRAGMRHLDVGCAEGTLLTLTRARGLNVQGLELDVNFSQFAREVRHLDVLPCTLENAPLQPASFDFISFVHVVEHLVEPIRVLTEARSLLRDEGLLFLEVPNIQQPLPGIRRFFRPKHNFYFSAKTLRSLAEESGFEVVKLRVSPRDAALQLLARKGELPATPHAPRHRENARNLAKKIARDRPRWWLLLRLLSLRTLPQIMARKRALQRYGHLLENSLLKNESR